MSTVQMLVGGAFLLHMVWLSWQVRAVRISTSSLLTGADSLLAATESLLESTIRLHEAVKDLTETVEMLASATAELAIGVRSFLSLSDREGHSHPNGADRT